MLKVRMLPAFTFEAHDDIPTEDDEAVVASTTTTTVTDASATTTPPYKRHRWTSNAGWPDVDNWF